MKEIYAITVFQKISRARVNSPQLIPDFGDIWCVGWFDNLSEAQVAVEENFDDIHHGHDLDITYDYAIIEKIGSGLFNIESERYLYKWNNETEKFENIALTREIYVSSNFGIG